MKEDLNLMLDNATTALHFAAQPDVGLGIEHPKWDIEINARGRISPVKQRLS